MLTVSLRMAVVVVVVVFVVVIIIIIIISRNVSENFTSIIR